MTESSATLVDLTSSEVILDLYSEPGLGAYSPYWSDYESSFQYDKWQTDHIYQLQLYVHSFMTSFWTEEPFGVIRLSTDMNFRRVAEPSVMLFLFMSIMTMAGMKWRNVLK